MTLHVALEAQKKWKWTDAVALWRNVDSSLLRDLNVAICYSWLRDYPRVLPLLDRFLPWSNSLPELVGLSPECVSTLRRAFHSVELCAADAVADKERVNRCIGDIVDLGGEAHELVRAPVAVELEHGQLDVLEDVVSISDLLIPLTLYLGSFDEMSNKAAVQLLLDRYQTLERQGLEPLTTQQEQISAVIGLGWSEGPREFTPLEWLARPGVDKSDRKASAASRKQATSEGLNERVDDLWPGYVDELRNAFASLLAEVSRTDRNENATEYAKVYYLVKEFASYLPIMRAVVKKGTSLYRARTTTDAGCEKDLSYVPEPTWIQSFGRVNAPGEPMFYCANDARTAVAEVLRDWFGTGLAGETRRVFVGRWLATQDIKTALVPYHEEGLAQSAFRDDVRYHFGLLSDQYAPATFTLVKECLAYIGSEFARAARTAFDYWVTTAYFNFATNPHNYSGRTESVPVAIGYPSVQMQYSGDNFATFPDIADAALCLIDTQVIDFWCLGGGRFTLDGRPPTWFAKRSRRFEF